MSTVTDISAATPEKAITHFQQRLSVETDCADVHSAIISGEKDFVLLHVIGSAESFTRCHIPEALHLPHRLINTESLNRWPEETLFVVYCAGPHCNGADRAALKLAQLGRKVKIMIGGIKGWEDEGLTFATT